MQTVTTMGMPKPMMTRIQMIMTTMTKMRKRRRRTLLIKSWLL
jgi:hypothetical protein